MFTRIVVGIDGSEGGRDAMTLARALARPATELILVAALPDEPALSLSEIAHHENVRYGEACERLRAVAEDDERARLIVETNVSPERALQAHAERELADLIVIGRAHHGRIGRVLHGDVSRATLHGAPCPVAVASRGYADSPKPIGVVGVACNDTDESRAALAFAASLADTIPSVRLHLVTVVTLPATFGANYGPGYNWAALKADIRQIAKDLLAALVADSPAGTTSETLEGVTGRQLALLSKRVDLIVAGSRGRGTAGTVLLGSTTDALVHHASCPVVVVPSPVAARNRASVRHT